MPRPIEAVISRSAIRHNIARIRQAAPGARLWGVVKANAYGHGIARVLPAMQDADGVALLDLNEAQLLRQLDYQGPILLLEGCFEAHDLETARASRLTVVLHCDEQLDLIAAARGTQPIDVYLKMNSGMNRLGFIPERLGAAYERLRATPIVREISLMTHFARAERPDGVAAAMERFTQATRGLAGERSLANSAATFMHPVAHGDWVRPGIALYGASPFAEQSAAALGLEPAMTLRSRLIAIQNLVPGDAVGYGARFVARAPMRVGVVACGYADGYPRCAPDGTPVLVAGERTGLVGTVSMDMITVDLSALPEAAVGTPVELWGAQLPVDDVAAAAGTVGYELLCALAPRVPVLLDD